MYLHACTYLFIYLFIYQNIVSSLTFNPLVFNNIMPFTKVILFVINN